jgi:hypothetical protein
MDTGTTITIGEEAEAPANWDSMVPDPVGYGDGPVESDANHSPHPTPPPTPISPDVSNEWAEPEGRTDEAPQAATPTDFDSWLEAADIEDLDQIADRLARGEVALSETTDAPPDANRPPEAVRSIAPPPPPAEADDEGPARARVRLTNADDRAVVELAKGEGISLLEAAQRVLAEKRAEAASEIDGLVEIDGDEDGAEKQPPAKADGAPLTVADAEARLYDLEAEADKAQFEDYDDRRAYELRREIRELRRSLPAIAEAERASRETELAQAKADYDRQWGDAETRAHALFPELAQSPESSPVMAEMQRLDAQAKEGDPALWSSPTKYFDLAVQAAINLRKSSTPASSASPAPSAPRNPAARGVMAAPAARATAPAATPRFDERLEEIRTADEMADFDLALGIR